MPINSVNQNTKTAPSPDKVFNPKSQLDKDAFLKLFIKQLEMQDPTDPMDTDKMLEQTASLTTLEMNQNMQSTLEKLASQLSQSQELNTISAIGKMADTGERYLNVTDEDKSKSFELYFGNDISSGKVIIKNKKGDIVREFPLQAHTKGILSFDWDLTDNNGKRVPSDTYEITAKFTSPDNTEHQTALGAYPIESVRFEDGSAYAKLGNNYVPFSKIKEIYEWQG